ncbi:Fur-regulated basic protein FbpA [Bacillus thuringiensis LM1212]|uniref:Fur-regulated basic protein FbpA n=1 Tax=Bacillus cereus group TaxID=86661 RepID=UPI0003FE2440|nr:MULTISPECIES: Fur-regulated basic protein FbpA [Bacillus cereus group]AXY06553.1 Fur-regulated basic protein FbpA [Bacillus thuringiensis LM1212]QDF24947.1 Fur-regulated basic protein FbpA [Bacillus tropicus]QUG98264.1 Fur-regulated basic protein FbpA [Bacillus tropicus]
MNRKQIYIDVLIQKGIYKEEKTGRQLYEMDENELWKLLKGDRKNGSNGNRCL